MDWNIPLILQLAGSAIVGLLCVLYSYHENRLKSLELTRMNKSDADKQRNELRAEVQNFRDDVSKRFEALTEETTAKRLEAHYELRSFKADIGGKVEVMRTETNDKIDKVFDSLSGKIDKLYDQIMLLSSPPPKRARR